MSVKVRFVGKENSGFYAMCKSSVNQYFEERNLSKKANRQMCLKSVFFIGGTVILYGLLISNRFQPLPMLFLALLLGMFVAFTCFNVGHDAIHGAYSNSPKINGWLSLSFNILGANAYLWSIQHNQIHHMYTNIPGHDEDIEIAPGLIRLSPKDKIYKIQKFQHLYGFFLYSLASIVWVFKKDYVKFFQKRIGSLDTSNHSRIEWFNLFFYKILYYSIFILIPLLVLNITWGQFLTGFLVMHLAEGLVLGLVFQLAHVVEGTEFPFPNKRGEIEEVWALHQLQTTANFSVNSPIASFFCGGLNYQIEHHLFPSICHIHYPSISKLIKEIAHAHGVPYIENITFYDALRSHYRMLKKFGPESQNSFIQCNP